MNLENYSFLCPRTVGYPNRIPEWVATFGSRSCESAKYITFEQILANMIPTTNQEGVYEDKDYFVLPKGYEEKIFIKNLDYEDMQTAIEMTAGYRMMPGGIQQPVLEEYIIIDDGFGMTTGINPLETYAHREVNKAIPTINSQESMKKDTLEMGNEDGSKPPERGQKTSIGYPEARERQPSGNQYVKATTDGESSKTYDIESDGIGANSFFQEEAVIRFPFDLAHIEGYAKTIDAEKEIPQVNKQIETEILQRLDKKGPLEFKMQLRPQELGQIEVNIKMHQGKLTIDILSESERTQNLLFGKVDRLIAGMGLHNVQIENIHINCQTPLDMQGENRGAFMNSAMDFTDNKRQQQSLHQQENEKFGDAAKANHIPVIAGIRQKEAGRIMKLHRMNYAI